jgi:Baseplate J-like protein
MQIPLPNLDDRRWADLVEEGLALIPVHAPGWTDHNIHDPGITLIELFAWLAETGVYRINRIPDRYKRKFLALLGTHPLPPRPARSFLRLELAEGAEPLSLPATLEFTDDSAAGVRTRFCTIESMTVASNRLRAIQIRRGSGYENLTERWQRGESFGAFGDMPQSGAELYLGFDRPLPVNAPVNLFFSFAGSRSGIGERRRLLLEAQSLENATPPPAFDDHQIDLDQVQAPPHHDARTVWEFLSEGGEEETWLELDSDNGEVEDDTRAFSLDGGVRLRLPREMPALRRGRIETELFYLRCRYVSGAYDAPPEIQKLVVNGVVIEQSPPAGAIQWPIAAGAAISGPLPEAGAFAQFNLRFNAQGQIVELEFIENVPNLPSFLVLNFEPGATQPGILSVEAALVGFGTGRPHQVLSLPQAPVITSGFRLYTLEDGNWREWRNRPDFDASTRGDADFTLDPDTGAVTFSDGERGRVLPLNAMVVAQYRTTRAESGNLPAGAIRELADSPHNRALLSDFEGVAGQLLTIENPAPAAGGTAGETLADVAGRAITLMNTTRRAVTIEDYERLALETPGAHVARATARANFDPDFPKWVTVGTTTVIALPETPEPRPFPSPGLLRIITSYLYRRRVIGTRVKVVGPNYKVVTVQARVRARPGANRVEVRSHTIAALNAFFHPLTGGPERTGWPFGRDVYRAEVLQTIDEVPGVDYVEALELIPGQGRPVSGNVSLAPLELVAAGEHRIEVT